MPQVTAADRPPSVSARARPWYAFNIWRVSRAGVIAYLVVLWLLMIFEEALIFYPDRYPAGDWNPPGLAFEDAWFTSADGVRLHGWYVPHAQPLGVVLYCHGNGGNISGLADTLRLLHDRVQTTVLAFDYRGYGRSAGQPNIPGILADARAARAWLACRAGVPESQIVMLGDSLGGGVAVDLAARDGARALVVQSTFDSLVDVAAYHYCWAPVRLLMRSRLDSAAHIGVYHGPFLQGHGDRDSIVPLRFAQRLYAAANEPKQFVLFANADHNAVPREFYEAFRRLLQGLPPH